MISSCRLAGHPVERLREVAELVPPVELDPLLVRTAADRRRGDLHALDRPHEATREQHRERDRPGHEREEQEDGAPHRPAERGEDLALRLLDEHLPPGGRHGRPGAEHMRTRLKLRPVVEPVRELPSPSATWGSTVRLLIRPPAYASSTARFG